MDERRQEIIEKAFEVWGLSAYTDTSLSSLAKALNISKAALYRYFKNKEEILREMEEYFLRQLSVFHETKRGDWQNLTPIKLGQDFPKSLILFFHANPFFYYFFVFYFLKGHPEKQEDIMDFMREKWSFFEESMKPALNKPEYSPDMLVVYLQSLIGFTLSVACSITNMGKNMYSQDKTLELYHNLLEGAGIKELESDFPFEKLEQLFWVSPKRIPEPNRIFKAIAKVVSEKGPAAASMDEIAGELGMSKSSLYFHFKNKESMLLSLMRENTLSLFEVFQEKARHAETPAEKIYGLMIVFSHFIMKQPVLMTVSYWFRFQGIKFKPFQQKELFQNMDKIFPFIKEGIQKGELRELGLDTAHYILFLVFFTGHKLDFDCQHQITEVKTEEMRLFFKLFYQGYNQFFINIDNNNKEESL